MPLPDPVTAGIAAGASLIGGHFSSRAMANESKRNRAFQERMRATQYQTAVADMRAAGLNPALAYDQGGAGTPSGSTMDVSQFGEAMKEAVPRGLEAASARMALRQQTADVEAAQYNATTAGERSKQERLTTLKMMEEVGATPSNFFTVDPKSPYASQLEAVRLRARQMGLGIAELEAMSRMWKDMGESGKVMQFLLPFLMLLRRF